MRETKGSFDSRDSCNRLVSRMLARAVKLFDNRYGTILVCVLVPFRCRHGVLVGDGETRPPLPKTEELTSSPDCDSNPMSFLFCE